MKRLLLFILLLTGYPAMAQQVPTGMTAEVVLPSGLSGEFVWGGERIPLKSGRQVINR